MNNMVVDIDPLGYDYGQYEPYQPIPLNDNPYYNHNLKPAEPMFPYNHTQQPYEPHLLQNSCMPLNNVEQNNENSVPQNTEVNMPLCENECTERTVDPSEMEDIKPDITELNVRKPRKRKSSYWSVKVTDKNFAFYGCSICNISFKTLPELDKHVTIHKDRITTYGLRVQNQIKKRKLKKEKKKLKKIKMEEVKLDIDIKPEDGYIGNVKVSDLNETNVDSNITESTMKNNGDMNNINESSNTNNSNIEHNIVNNSICQNSITNDSLKTEDVKPLKKNKKIKPKKEEDDSSQKIYKCFACQKMFLLSYYLRLHVRSHTDEKPYVCAICGQSFITASKRGRHMKRMHFSVRHQCRICYKYYSRFELLTKHFDQKHPDDKLEGEPYDYNTILPYLKELEAQLNQKSTDEKGDSLSKDEPMKDASNAMDVKNQSTQSTIESQNSPFDDIYPPMVDQIIIEEVKVDGVDGIEEVNVKTEVEEIMEREGEVQNAGVRDDDDDDEAPPDDDDPVKDESFSDEDYFPSNTWASTPKVEVMLTSPARTRKPKGTKGQAVTCDICNKVMKSKSYLKIHLRTHTGEKPFRCFVCDRGFITPSKMHRHALTHHGRDEKAIGDETIKTEVSEDIKPKTEELESEVKSEVTKISKKKTKSKKSKKKSKTEKTEKGRRKQQKRPHACEFCRQRFLHLDTLEMHRKSHEGEQIQFNCHFCLEPMQDATALREHEATHTGPKPYVCTVCGRVYKKREAMVYHRKHHKPDKEYICDMCSKRFPTQYKLQRHIAGHNVSKFIVRYECPVCAHLFHTKYHIQMHLATHQKEGLIMEENRNEILAMVLQNVRKIPTQPDGPPNLTTVMPSDERSRVCNICGEVFTHFFFLEEHLKTHGSKMALEDLTKKEEKKYVCEVCNKGFKLHYYLKLHSFTHTKEKPFICQQCGKGFITKGKLKRHLEVHTGLKKYQCHVCYKMFTRPSYLRIHVRTIHGTQDYNFRPDKVWGLGASSNLIGHSSI